MITLKLGDLLQNKTKFLFKRCIFGWLKTINKFLLFLLEWKIEFLKQQLRKIHFHSSKSNAFNFVFKLNLEFWINIKIQNVKKEIMKHSFLNMELEISRLARFHMTVFPSEATNVTESSDFSVTLCAAVPRQLCTSGHPSLVVPGRGRPRFCACGGSWGHRAPCSAPAPSLPPVPAQLEVTNGRT